MKTPSTRHTWQYSPICTGEKQKLTLCANLLVNIVSITLHRIQLDVFYTITNKQYGEWVVPQKMRLLQTKVKQYPVENIGVQVHNSIEQVTM